MRTRAGWLGIVLTLAMAAPAGAAPANTILQMYAELGRCLGPLRMARGTDITLRFSLNRRGEMIGKPVVTYAKFPDDPEARAETARSIAKVFAQCLPLSITDGLGGAIAGRPMAFRLRAPQAADGI